MNFNKNYATRLNSFASKPQIYWNSNEKITPIKLVERAGTVKGLTHLDLNYPDHAEKNFDDNNFLSWKTTGGNPKGLIKIIRNFLIHLTNLLPNKLDEIVTSLIN